MKEKITSQFLYKKKRQISLATYQNQQEHRIRIIFSSGKEKQSAERQLQNGARMEQTQGETSLKIPKVLVLHPHVVTLRPDNYSSVPQIASTST